MLVAFLRTPATLIAFLALACGAAQAGGGEGAPDEGEQMEPASSSAERQLPPEPKRTVAESNDIRILLRDVAVQNACEHEVGRFRGLAGNGESLREGRTFVEECKTESRGDDELMMRTGARGWRWIGKESKKLGATFKVNEYAKMRVELEIQGSVEIAYSRDTHVVNLYLVPTRPPKAHVKPMRQIDAEPEGAWSELLGAVSGIVGQSPDRQATRQVGRVGSQQFEKQMSKGYSLAVEMCTGQKHDKVGELPEGRVPAVPVPSEGRVWLENERIRLQPGGIDLSGPHKPTYNKLEAEVFVETGGPLRVRMICKEDAKRIALAFTDSKKLPQAKALANELIPEGGNKILKGDVGRCEPVLYASPGPKAKLPITFKQIIYEPGVREEPLVPCK